MIYTKPKVNEIGSVAEMIQGAITGGTDQGQYIPFPLNFEDNED